MWNGHGGVTWCLKGSRKATTAVNAHTAAAAATGPALRHLRSKTVSPLAPWCPSKRAGEHLARRHLPAFSQRQFTSVE